MFKKTILFVTIVTSFYFSGCDYRQQFPVRYDYESFAAFREAVENIEFTESEDNYGAFYFLFAVDENEYVTSFSLSGANYGTEQQLSESSHPLLSDMSYHIVQEITDGKRMIEIYPMRQQADDIDLNELTTASSADGYYDIYYLENRIIRIKGTDSELTAFIDDHLDDIAVVEAGKNHKPSD